MLVNDSLPDGAHPSVTKIIDRIPRHGEEAALEEALKRLNAAAARYPGFLGVTVMRPALPAQPGFRVIYRFASPAHLEAWEDSDERKDLRAEADQHTIGEPRTEVARGLETWLTLPPPPPGPVSRLRLAFVSWLGVFPLVALFVMLAELVVPPAVPRILSLAIVAMIVVLAMTYIVGPGLTRLFRNWLQARNRKR